MESLNKTLTGSPIWRFCRDLKWNHLMKSWMHQPKGVYGNPWHMSSLTFPKKVEDVVSSSSKPEPEYWDKVSETFFFKSLRCLMNSLSEGKTVWDRIKASKGIGGRTFETKDFEETFSPLMDSWKLLSIWRGEPWPPFDFEFYGQMRKKRSRNHL